MWNFRYYKSGELCKSENSFFLLCRAMRVKKIDEETHFGRRYVTASITSSIAIRSRCPARFRCCEENHKTLTHTSIWTHLWTVEGHPEEGIVRDIARFRLHGSTIRTPTWYIHGSTFVYLIELCKYRQKGESKIIKLQHTLYRRCLTAGTISAGSGSILKFKH